MFCKFHQNNVHASEVFCNRLTDSNLKGLKFSFALSYAASSVSEAIFVSARHVSERDPISITISMISFIFPGP